MPMASTSSDPEAPGSCMDNDSQSHTSKRGLADNSDGSLPEKRAKSTDNSVPERSENEILQADMQQAMQSAMQQSMRDAFKSSMHAMFASMFDMPGQDGCSSLRVSPPCAQSSQLGSQKKERGRDTEDETADLLGDLDDDLAQVTAQNMSDDDPDENINNEKEDGELDDVLDQLAQEFDGEEVTGPDVSEKLAAIVNRMARAKLAKEKLRDKMNDEAYRRPSNCQNLVVPKINPEMWDRIRPGIRSADIKVQKLQQVLQKAMMPVLQMYEDFP